MDNNPANRQVPLCPSAQPQMAEVVLFGVIERNQTEPRVGYLVEPLPVTPEILAIAEPVKPTQVFRFAAPCAGHLCQHFDGAECRLAERVAQSLPPVVDVLPPCRIRPQCRWWQQEGKAACMRCPQIVTETYNASEFLRAVAQPTPLLERLPSSPATE